MNSVKRKTKNLWSQVKRVTFFFLLGGILLFSAHFYTICKKLDTAFLNQKEYLPTRIYSDCTPIRIGQHLEWIKKQFHRLSYPFIEEPGILKFQLNPVDYPLSLLPEKHFQTFMTQPIYIDLIFNSTSQLKSIEFHHQSIEEIYLEPQLIATLSRSSHQAIRKNLSLENIPALVWKAIIATEDQYFLDHSGIDFRGFARALLVNLKRLKFIQGGSTITQQLIKNLMSRRTKNVFKKFNEFFLALFLEFKYKKEKILERYLNEVYLGQVGHLEIHGVAEGAEHFFGKKLENLNLAEIALLVGLIRGPTYYSPYKYFQRALERQYFVLKRMVETKKIELSEAKLALKQPIRLSPPKYALYQAPFFVDYVKSELIQKFKHQLSETEVIDTGFRVYTTLNPDFNHLGQAAVQKGIQNLEAQVSNPLNERLEGVLVSVENDSGYIRALIGGKNYRHSSFNRAFNMRRQIGSTFKPFVYLTAFSLKTDSQGIPYSPAHPILDEPWTLIYNQGKQSWQPKNYSHQYRGWITFRQALVNSINVPTARLGWEIGLQKIIKTAQDLGIQSPLYPVPSLALGISELSPLELLKVYTTLASRGERKELTSIRTVTLHDKTPYANFINHRIKAYDSASIDLLTHVLQDVFYQGSARYAAQRFNFHFPAAGKTGTTNHYRDAWFAGYTPEYTTVVWVGMDKTNINQPPTLRLTGARAALPIWMRYMKSTLQYFPMMEFPKSPFLKKTKFDRRTGLKASRTCPRDQIITDYEICNGGH